VCGAPHNNTSVIIQSPERVGTEVSSAEQKPGRASRKINEIIISTRKYPRSSRTRLSRNIWTKLLLRKLRRAVKALVCSPKLFRLPKPQSRAENPTLAAGGFLLIKIHVLC